jgi:outer membrane protein OmpA-like peptidoglycan-associated protein
MNQIKRVHSSFFIILLALSCSMNDELTVERSTEHITHKNVAEIVDITPKEDRHSDRLEVSWNTPFLTPVGVDISKVIRAYFMVGEYETMLKFVIHPECYSKQEIKNKLRKSAWGYEIKSTNLQWNADSSFILTVKTSKQQTVGSEQYFGRIINDTAKLILFPEKEDLFPYYGDENLNDPCELKTAIDNILFEFDRASILKSSFSALNKITEFLKSNRSYNAHFVGHTSIEGDFSRNLELSKQRAEAICDYLINAGISESRLSYEGKGSTDPIYPNDTENARSHNRRVEMKLTRMEK